MGNKSKRLTGFENAIQSNLKHLDKALNAVINRKNIAENNNFCAFDIHILMAEIIKVALHWFENIFVQYLTAGGKKFATKCSVESLPLVFISQEQNVIV